MDKIKKLTQLYISYEALIPVHEFQVQRDSLFLHCTSNMLFLNRTFVINMNDLPLRFGNKDHDTNSFIIYMHQ